MAELGVRVGRRVRELREERGLSLSGLARASGVGKATLSELEAGRRNPTLETLYALTTALHVPLSAALTGPSGPSGEAGGTRGPDGPDGPTEGRAGARRAGPGRPERADRPGGPGWAAEAVVAGEAVTALLVERFEDAAGVTDVFRVRIAADARQVSAAHVPGVWERLVVLAGTALVGDPALPRTVGAGGQARFAGDAPHVYAAPGGDVEGVLFVRYPLPAGGAGSGAVTA